MILADEHGQLFLCVYREKYACLRLPGWVRRYRNYCPEVCQFGVLVRSMMLLIKIMCIAKASVDLRRGLCQNLSEPGKQRPFFVSVG